MRDGREGRVALAGIAATAVVGLAGSLATLVATHETNKTQRAATRETNATQRAVSRDSTLYAARASAYIDALSAENEWLVSQSGRSFGRWAVKWSAKHPKLRARMEAYGTPEALRAYDGMMHALLHRQNVPSAVNVFEDVVTRDLR